MSRRWLAALASIALPAGLLLAGSWSAQAGTITPDVVNGRPPVAGEFAYLAMIRSYPTSSQYYTCGGAFVSSRHVVTAAHCVQDDEGRAIDTVKVGAASGTSQPTAFVMAERVEAHEGFSEESGVNDIALITLERPVTGAVTLRVPTAQQWQSLTGQGAKVASAGWGATYSGGGLAPKFTVADLAVIPDSVCGDMSATYQVGSLTYLGIGGEFDETTMICAGGATSLGLPIDTCQGDSGGPLTADDGVTVYLVGIVSWGNGCAGMDEDEAIPLTPGVYTRLGTYLDWLAQRGVAPLVDPPGAPTGLTVVAKSKTRVVLNWTAPTDDGGYPITRYRIDYSEDGGNFTRLGTTPDAQTEREIMNLTPGSTYVFRVAAINAMDKRGAFSIPSAPYTMPGGRVTRPGEVTGFSHGRFIKEGNRYRVKVTWQQPTETGGGEISGYVARLGLAGNWGAWTDLTKPSIKIARLKTGKNYTLQVRAVNSAGPGAKASYFFRTPKR